MALIGFLNKVTEDIYLRLLLNKNIAKLLYYTNNTTTLGIEELEEVSNPIGKLKNKVFRNRRIEKLQRETDVGMTVSIYSKSSWKDLGIRHDYTLENLIEVGIISHLDIDETVNGSRVYALIDLTIQELSNWNVEGLGKIHFQNMYKIKDLDLEYTGYWLYFTIDNLRSEI